MNLIESLLIIGGISLDIFATMEIQGSMLAQVKRKSLIVACAIASAFQLAFFFGGYLACKIVGEEYLVDSAYLIGEVLAVVVFILLGIRLLVKAIKREFIHEKRKDSLGAKELIGFIVATSCYTLAIGCVFGLVGVNSLQIFFIILIITVAVVVAGLYVGLHFGFTNKPIVYAIGTVCLWAAGTEILLHEVLQLL